MRAPPVLLVGLGGGLGAIARYLVGVAAAARWPHAALPIGTLAINVAGSLALGVLAGVAAATGRVSEPVRLTLATGVIGGFTTYSTFNQETLALAHGGRPGNAALYVALTIVLGLLAGALGWFGARAVL